MTSIKEVAAIFMVKFKLNQSAYSKFKAQIADAFATTIATIDEEMDAVIEDSNEFSDLGFDDQDIVDTGRLRDSKLLNVQTEDDGITAEWTWNPHDPETGYAYAMAVYAGFNAFGKKQIPGRPWPERAIERVDVLKSLATEMKLRGVPAKVRKKVLGSL